MDMVWIWNGTNYAGTNKMDALGNDVYWTEIQENVEKLKSDEASSSTSEPVASGGGGDRSSERASPQSQPTTSTTTTEYYVASDLATGTTMPVGDDAERGLSHQAERAAHSSTKSSTSSSSSSEQRSYGSASLYQPEFMAPKISYERENEHQRLVAIIGREFDRPSDIADALQGMIPKQPDCDIAVAKLVPFTLRRKVLLKGSFDGRELKQHDLICMCYNASEARILLMGPDGFYTILLKYIETLLGPNKAAFLITNYTPPLSHLKPPTEDAELISPPLRTRLHSQEPLRPYLERGQVLSWNDTPSELHAMKLVELANSELNPQGFLASVSQCQLL